MRVGITLPMLEVFPGGAPPTWSEILGLARTAERHGLDSVWCADHLIYRPPEGGDFGPHEAWTLMSAVASATERISIGSLVMCTPLRNPGLVANMAATFDRIAPGRLVLGVGAGWHDPEFEAFGLPTDHKVGRFEEWIEIVARLLRGERLTFSGRYFSLRDAIVLPPPENRIPILVGSTRPRMHSLAARWADAWNTSWHGAPDEHLDERSQSFEEALHASGREPESLLRTAGMIVRDPDQVPADGPTDVFDGSVDALAAALNAYSERGFGEVIVKLQPATTRSLERLAEARSLAAVQQTH